MDGESAGGDWVGNLLRAMGGVGDDDVLDLLAGQPERAA
jgi:hypothetical protein